MLNGLVICLVFAGLFFFFGTSVGLIRFPDFYSRMHAAGKGDTLSSLLLLAGLALYHLHQVSFDTLIVSSKIMFICIFIFVASPTATHAIMDAGYESQLRYWTKRRNQTEPWPGPERRLETKQPE